jgi:hypothetical protein
MPKLDALVVATVRLLRACEDPERAQVSEKRDRRVKGNLRFPLTFTYHGCLASPFRHSTKSGIHLRTGGNSGIKKLRCDTKLVVDATSS